jgi:hypothetical protein
MKLKILVDDFESRQVLQMPGCMVEAANWPLSEVEPFGSGLPHDYGVFRRVRVSIF